MGLNGLCVCQGSCQTQNFVNIVSHSIIEDLLNAVARSVHLVSTNSTIADFSGSAVEGSFPASAMGFMNSGNASLDATSNYC